MPFKSETNIGAAESPLQGRRRRSPAKNESDKPLYVRVASTLKDEIVRGVFPVGSQLPTEDDLCKRFSISRHTVREALRRLRDENLVSSHKRAGTKVTPPRSSGSYVQDIQSIRELLAFATSWRLEIESIKTVTLDDKLASRTGLTSGENWLAIAGLAYRNGSDPPICWAECYIARRFAGVGRLLEHHTGAIFPLLENLFGVRIMEVHQKMSASLISPALASRLKVKANTAALNIRHTFKLVDGEIAQVAIGVHPASRFEHSMTMRRVQD